MKLKDFFIHLLTDAAGKFSLMRILKFGALTTTFIIWAIISLETGELVDIPENVAYINIALIVGKAVQKIGEK